MINISLSDFKKYFNSNFWRVFREKVLFYSHSEVSSDEKNKIIEQLYFDLKNWNYYPSNPRNILYKEKWEWVPRIIPVFEIKDYCLYYFCIKQLENRIALNRTPNTFWGWSLGGLIRSEEELEVQNIELIMHEFENEMANYYDVSISEYSFNPKAWAKAYGDFNAKLYTSIQTNSNEWCVEFDIANFYDSINLNILELSIKEIATNDDRETIALLFHFLQFWNRKSNVYNKSTVWVPQDALWDCSRILANFYLQRYDQYINWVCGSDFQYFRYADDQFIFWNSKEELMDIIFKASIYLNKIWLNINQKKVIYWKKQDLLKHRSFELFDSVSDENITEDSMRNFFKEVVILYKENANEKLKHKWLSLLNKAIMLDFNLATIADRTYILWILLDDFYLKQAKPFQLWIIYGFLSETEKESFLDSLYSLARSYRYNEFHYSFLQFLENNNLDTIRLKVIISDLNNSY